MERRRDEGSDVEWKDDLWIGEQWWIRVLSSEDTEDCIRVLSGY